MLVLVLVVVLPTSPRRLRLHTSPRRLDSERLRQASREATSGRLSSRDSGNVESISRTALSLLSRRDFTMVAWHEMPGKGVKEGPVSAAADMIRLRHIDDTCRRLG
jgi:hypothetical protein